VRALSADGHLLVLGFDVGTHVQELVNDAKKATHRGEVKRSAVILRWQSGGGAKEGQWQKWSMDQIKILCGGVRLCSHADRLWQGPRPLQRKWGGQAGEAVHAVSVESAHAVKDGAFKMHAALLGWAWGCRVRRGRACTLASALTSAPFLARCSTTAAWLKCTP
jgi:hypothetical protein